MMKIQALILKFRSSFLLILLLLILEINLKAQRRDYVTSLDTMLYVHKVLVEAERAKPYSGLLEEYYPGKSIKYRIVLDKGVPTGKYIEWYPDSIVRCVFYFDENGLEQGEFKAWEESGDLDIKGFFKNGLKDSIWLYFVSDSIVMKKGRFEKGLKQGRFYYYTPIGELHAIEEYKNDTLVDYLKIMEFITDEDEE